MSIAMASALPIGNAIRIALVPPSGTTRTRVLRAEVDSFSGPDDPQAYLAWEGDAPGFVDATAANDTDYWYKPFHKVGGVWIPADSMPGRATASYVDNSVDALSIVRERMAAGMVIESQRETLIRSEGPIQVLLAPPLYDDTRFPIVTVHLQSGAQGERYLGEVFGGDDKLESGLWVESEGWLERDTIEVIGWCLNPDVRLELRKAIRRIVVGNLAVFDALGLLNVEVSFSDTEDFETYPAAIYQVMCTLTCNAPVTVSGTTDAIDDVTVTGIAIQETING